MTKEYRFKGESFFECKDVMEKWISQQMIKIALGIIIFQSSCIERIPDKDEFLLSIKYYESSL